MYTTGGSSTPYYRFDFCVCLCTKSAQGFSGIQPTLEKKKPKISWDRSPARLILILTVNYYLLRVKHQPNGEQTTLGCLRMAPCGVRLLLIHTSMVLMMTVRKRRKKRKPARKAA